MAAKRYCDRGDRFRRGKFTLPQRTAARTQGRKKSARLGHDLLLPLGPAEELAGVAGEEAEAEQGGAGGEEGAGAAGAAAPGGRHRDDGGWEWGTNFSHIFLTGDPPSPPAPDRPPLPLPFPHPARLV